MQGWYTDTNLDTEECMGTVYRALDLLTLIRLPVSGWITTRVLGTRHCSVNRALLPWEPLPIRYCLLTLFKSRSIHENKHQARYTLTIMFTLVALHI